MNYETKKKLFKAGHYVFDAPPVSTAYWFDKDWMKYIDSHGQWDIKKDSIK